MSAEDEAVIEVDLDQELEEPAQVESGSKRLRSILPDVVVSVGMDDEKQEFDCYSVILCFASPYFDAMLSSPMQESSSKRISFPDKDPKEWREVYKFMDPMELRDAKVDDSNVKRLLPWFHLFQMTRLIQECDQWLKTKVPTVFKSTKDITAKRKDMDESFATLVISHMYNLPGAMMNSRCAIRGVLDDACELLSVDDIQKMIDVTLGISEDDDDYAFVTRIMNWLKANLPDSVEKPSEDNKESLLKMPLFSHLVHAELKSKIQKKQMDSFVQTLPEKIYHAFPGGRSTRPYRADDFARHKLKRVIYNERSKLRGISEIPAEWNNPI